MRKVKVLLATLLAIFVFKVQGQAIHQFAEKLEDYNLSHPQEKLYLQLDKFAYTTGESIWFKAYATIGINNLFSNMSGIAYVDLIDVSERKVDSLIIPLMLGIGLGDFVLPDTLTEGSYRLRAYTSWMRNAGKEYFYDRTIQVSNGRSDNVSTNTSFLAGEKNNTYTIQLRALSGAPLAKTNVRYEVVSKGKVVERKRATTDDLGHLKIELNKKYKDGQISLQFANQEKVTVNKFIKIVDETQVNHIDILPEGGRLLEGFLNTVGVKSINKQGLGKKATVMFTNGRDTLGECVTNELGMGAYNLFLSPGDSLYAFSMSDDGVRTAVQIPKIHKSGYSLQVNNQNVNRVFAQLNASSDVVNGEEIYFVVHHLGKVFFLSKQKLNKEELSFSLDKKELPSGVITITILNSKFMPIAERPIFSYKESDLLGLDIGLDKATYGHREKVSVNLNVLGNDTLKVSALSASVLNLSKIKDNPNLAPSILSGLLLSADLKGYIESPGYYFEDKRLKGIDMDYLMLTQGWRNLDWAALDLQVPVRYPAEKTLSISGYTKKLGRSKAEPNAKVQLISTKNFMDFIDTTSNEEGYFNFDNLLFVDSIKFLISAKDAAKGKSNIDIVYNKPVMAEVGENRNGADERWDVNLLYAEELSNSKKYFSELERAGLKEKAIQIEEVVVQARQEPKVSKHSSNLNGAGRADQIITAEDLSTCSSLEICLSGRLMGVTWQGGVPYNTRGNVPMQVVVDGMFIEPDQLSMINVADVESIEVLRSINYTSIYGSNGGNGILVITSKRGDSAMRRFTPKGIVTIMPKGIHMNRQYYKPKYDVSNSVNAAQDLRTLIHWEPSIVTNREGKASFDFYTADEKGQYLIIVEGLNLFGKICRELKIIEVK